jgi:mevalonate kinase
MIFESNGKILLTSEYLVLDGAISLALPSKLTQKLFVEEIDSDCLQWVSYDNNKSIWYEERFFKSGKTMTYKGKKNNISEKIISLFNHIHNYKNIQNSFGKKFVTRMNFNRQWGLGSSSTLVNNLAKWANISPYDLLFSSFKGSGYDIACCDKKHPILYSNNKDVISIDKTSFNPSFKKNLFFIYQGKKTKYPKFNF